ncbi:OPT oligopeptide transporter protein-domain-containing protein, partial [Limtongia smithiae]|uniref:OPT oligopeptide transporter protein-domain-containing protein n=1 Tax=Limtongia smithiae TaxID=1125753 RepID=UPI0034CDFEFF
MSTYYEDKGEDVTESVLEVRDRGSENTGSLSDDIQQEKFNVDINVDDDHLPETVIDRIRASGDMDDILAGGFADFFVDKLRSMSVEEAVTVLTYALEYHNHDINFPSKTHDRISLLLQGEDAYGQGATLYNLDLRLEAAFMKYHSPYPEVRAVCTPIDDPTMPVETLRAYVIGYFWVAVAGFINQLIYFRQPHFTLSSQVIQLLVLPCGQFCARVLPNWTLRIGKISVELNPGPWNHKEQMLATIITNVGAANAVWGQYFPVLRETIFYGAEWSDYGFNLLFNIICQFFGLGMAGVLRRWVVYPSKAVWPTVLPTLQLNRTLLLPEKRQNINGWTISKYKLFNILLAVAFVYFFIPDYLFTGLSSFAWIAWAAPNNKNVAFVTGSTVGLGYNPWPTFDWSVINYATPLVRPFFSYINQYIGALVGGIILLIIFYSNLKYTAYIPPNTSTVHDRFGASYNISAVIDSDGTLVQSLYEAYSPPYISAGYYMYLCTTFTTYTFTVVYIFISEWRTMKEAMIGVYTSIKNRKASNFDQYRDPLSVMMKEYKEVPDWWFYFFLAFSVIVASITLKAYPTHTPVWCAWAIFAVAIAMLIPFMVLYATTGFFMSTNNMGTILGGYMVSGSGIACLLIRALGYSVEDQAESYISDQKLGHYAKLPPRAVFRGQLSATILQVFVTSGAMELAHGIVDFCSLTQPSKFYCTWSHSIYTGTLLFGAVGPQRTFDTLYPLVKWCFLIGGLAALPLYYLRLYFPKYLRYFHPVLFLGGISVFGTGYNLTYYTVGAYLSIIFMWYLRTRKLAWWSKYNYIISAGLSAGIAFSGILIFLALQYRPKTLTWWGNSITSTGIDGEASEGLKDIPEIGYFGPAPGSWH